MDILLLPKFPLIIAVGICVMLVLQEIAKRKGYLVKVEYSKPKRLFWAVLISLIVACNSVVLENMYFILLAFVIGLYLYFFKQYYTVKPKQY